MTVIRNTVHVTLIIVGSVHFPASISLLFVYGVSSRLLAAGLALFSDINLVGPSILVVVLSCNNIAKSKNSFIFFGMFRYQPKCLKRHDDESGS